MRSYLPARRFSGLTDLEEYEMSFEQIQFEDYPEKLQHN